MRSSGRRSFHEAVPRLPRGRDRRSRTSGVPPAPFVATTAFGTETVEFTSRNRPVEPSYRVKTAETVGVGRVDARASERKPPVVQVRRRSLLATSAGR
ncbi:hypothetical protein DMJ13_11805 [halophilic archaeon]|nr:hypothetical protein DMJ13_11805 [halophilic archaeon]